MFVKVSICFDSAGRSAVEKQGRLSCHCLLFAVVLKSGQVYELYYSSCTVLCLQTEERRLPSCRTEEWDDRVPRASNSSSVSLQVRVLSFDHLVAVKYKTNTHFSGSYKLL